MIDRPSVWNFLWISALLFMSSLLSSKAEIMDSVNKSVAGVWRSDAGEIITIHPKGPVMGSVQNFSGLADQHDSVLTIATSKEKNGVFLTCSYNISQYNIYNLKLDLDKKSDASLYCPHGAFHKIDDFK